MSNMQFTSLTLENYKAFDNITFNLMETKERAKKMLAIYGENGVGKSTVISSFKNLRISLETRNNRNKIEQLSHIPFDKLIKSNVTLPPVSFKDIFKNVPTISDSEDKVTKVKYNFLIDNKKGSYLLKFNKEELLEEKLEFTILKNKGILFDISKENFKLNKLLFKNQTLRNKVNELIETYCGNHSFLSIINEIIDQKNINIKTIFPNLIKVVSSFKKICVLDSSVTALHYSVPSLLEGNISSDDKKRLNFLKSIGQQTVKSFLRRVNSNFLDAEYEFKNVGNQLHYELLLTERINNEPLKINFHLASDGIKSFIKLLPFIADALDGCVVVIDEVDKDIHDLLLIEIIDELNNCDINGQFIFSTHNTLLMDYIGSKDIYCINSNLYGKRAINKIGDTGRISVSSNIAKQYREGKFYGIPYLDDLHIDQLSRLSLTKSDKGRD